MDEQKRTYRKWLKRNHGGLSFTSNDNYPNWPNKMLSEHFIWWQGGRIGIEPPINRDSIATTSETKKRQKLSRTTSAVIDSESVATSASIELSHEFSHENRSGTSVEHIKTTTIKLGENIEEKMIERSFESVEVAETKKAILKQKVKVIKKRLEMQKTEHIDSTWSSIKTRLFSRTPDNNLKKYIGISLAPRAPDKQVCEEEIIRRKMEVDNNFALSDEEKVIEKTKIYHEVWTEFDRQNNAHSRGDDYGVLLFVQHEILTCSNHVYSLGV